MNIFFLFGQAALIPETKPPCGNEDRRTDSYGTFVSDRRGWDDGIGQDLEIVLNSTEFVVTINRRDD